MRVKGRKRDVKSQQFIDKRVAEFKGGKGRDIHGKVLGQAIIANSYLLARIIGGHSRQG